MSHLKNLKLATATPVRVNVDPTQRVREKIIALLDDQKAMANANIAGETFTPTRRIWAKDENGQRVQVEKAKRVRPGWFEGVDGKTYFGIEYAGASIPLHKDLNAVEVSSLDQLPMIIDQLIAATKAGELDAQLQAAAEKRSKQLRNKVVA